MQITDKNLNSPPHATISKDVDLQSVVHQKKLHQQSESLYYTKKALPAKIFAACGRDIWKNNAFRTALYSPYAFLVQTLRTGAFKVLSQNLGSWTQPAFLVQADWWCRATNVTRSLVVSRFNWCRRLITSSSCNNCKHTLLYLVQLTPVHLVHKKANSLHTFSCNPVH